MSEAWMVPRAYGTEEGMEPDDLLCSRNARLEEVLGHSPHSLRPRFLDFVSIGI